MPSRSCCPWPTTSADTSRASLSGATSSPRAWEGLAGSALLAIAVAYGATWLLFPGVVEQRWWLPLGLGLLAPATATLGDLSESLLKRDLGVKDMGNLLKGHGGLLDRIDSIMISAPFLKLVMTVAIP